MEIKQSSKRNTRLSELYSDLRTFLMVKFLTLLCYGGQLSQTQPHCYSPQQNTGLAWWLSGKESASQCRRHRFNPWAGKIPWRRTWQPSPVFLPGKSHGQRSLMGCSPVCGAAKELDMAQPLNSNNDTRIQIAGNMVAQISLGISYRVLPLNFLSQMVCK